MGEGITRLSTVVAKILTDSAINWWVEDMSRPDEQERPRGGNPEPTTIIGQHTSLWQAKHLVDLECQEENNLTPTAQGHGHITC